MKEKNNIKHDDLEQATCCGCAQVNQNQVTDSKRRNLFKYLALAILISCSEKTIDILL